MTSGDRITLHEAAERLGVHYMTAYRYVRTGRLPAERDGVQWMVDPVDLDRMRPPGRAPGHTGAVRAAGPAKVATRLVAGDEAGAWAVIDAALVSGVDPAGVYLDLLVPALRSIGDGWAAGRLTVADEHRATAVSQRLIGRLGPRFARRGRKRGTVVVGAPAGEEHALPVAIVADLLRGRGYEVLDTGANTPAQSFTDTALGATRLVAVAIAVTMPGRNPTIRSTVRSLRRNGVTAPILVGGAAVTTEEEALALGADAWCGPDAASVLVAVEAAAGR